MLDTLINHFTNPRTMAMVFAAVAAIATVLTLAMPLLANDLLAKRMKAVSVEREKLRQRERERQARTEKVALRRSPKQYMLTIVNQFQLAKWVGQDEMRMLLTQAGYRGHAPYITFLFFRMVMPMILLFITAIYVFALMKTQTPAAIKVGICIVATYIRIYIPTFYIKNKISARQLSIRRAFPDALDLLLICAESGMSIEAGLKKVAFEIGSQSIALAEELALTM